MRHALRGFERRRFLSLVDDVVRPEAPLPPVVQTDALEAFERWLSSAPLLYRSGLRLILLAQARIPAGDEVLRRLAAHCYYGDTAVMRTLGYDADAVIARARALRLTEGRP
ncbi:MAG: hypothetical protein AVDCRST_MAG85-1380 [uncultured Solirubrobacteraceae bacterium]|uniref:Uncharacterized protein n=1 Tax=uncultured Solirubrobacteraceae bacterium TaxID=1162706 RepID=A0A6J4SAZ2_9ACTN|nr:MAG: hypothetical protein AVDCRST_MAG85-1380 [uncultured Solirubrobacteraceae bacterium]